MNIINEIYRILEKEVSKYKAPVIELVKAQTKSADKILVATILSSRTKDETTAKVSKRLFIKMDKISDLKKMSQSEIEKLIYPVGFYKEKAKNLKKLPLMLEKEFSGNIPRTIEELTMLPGVGRKTANLLLSSAFNIPAICVDVHVHRILNRIGYIRTKDPEETEMRLRKKIPETLWTKTNRIFVPYGQTICTPISPHCSKCKINNYCRKIAVGSRR